MSPKSWLILDSLVDPYYVVSKVFADADVMICSSCRWCTGTWSPATSSTWTIQETPTPFASVTSASPSSCEETTGCCWLPATRLTSWLPRWVSAAAHALRWQTLAHVSLICCRCWWGRATTPPVTSGVWESCSTPCWPGQSDVCRASLLLLTKCRCIKTNSCQLAFYWWKGVCVKDGVI